VYIVLLYILCCIILLNLVIVSYGHRVSVVSPPLQLGYP
jgi:hypothetical protein